MPSFKPKSNKKIKINKKTTTTLDGKHKEFLHDFYKDDTDKIPNLKFEKEEIEKKLDDNNVVLNIEDKMDMLDRLTEINKNIKSMKNKKKNIF